ncbi:peptidoglycan D,D-transpeptidase FtsI family protein [Rhodovibrionaceae bacterium A322]
MIWRRKKQPSEEVRPAVPCGLDLGGPRTWVVEMEGHKKAALETGRNRLLVAATVFSLAFLLVGGRLVQLAYFANEEPSGVVSTAKVARDINPVRGDILDRNGQVLATTLPTNSLYANSRQIRDPQVAADRLAAVLKDVSAAELRAKLTADKAFVYLKRNITPRETAAVNALGIPGLNFERGDRRFYPAGPLTSHVVGFTNIDNKGLAGMELAFDDLLSGSKQPLRLSLDLRIQHILAEELAASMEEFRGIGAAGVVLDAYSGEVLSMVSLPTYDPGRPGEAPGDARFNRATLGVYEMGSVFKIFTTALALDSKAVTINNGYNTSNPIRVGRFAIKDYKPKKRWLSVPEIFMYSSNIGTVHMAMDSGTDTLKRYFGDLGLLRASSLELPEVGQPMLPTPWRPVSTMTASYGHGIAVTPMQTARAVAAVVNGGELPPLTLLQRAEDEVVPRKRVFSAKTSEQMRWLMRLVVAHGTGRFAQAEGYLVGGKTGTADKLNPNGGYARNKRMATFAAAFPMNDPRYVLLAMVDEPKGIKRTYGYATAGWVAAPVVGRTVARMAPLLGIKPVGEEADKSESLLIQAKISGPTRATE